MIIITILSVILLAAADQGLKALAVSKLVEGQSVTVLSAGDTDILTFSLYKNTGAAFSSLQGKIPLLIIITVVLMALLVAGLVKYKLKAKFPLICMIMILGGGIGNLIDRALLGYVVDFIILFPFKFIFNFADICVVIGAILLLIYFIFFDKQEDEKPAENVSEENSQHE